jgi:hypothetical protein
VARVEGLAVGVNSVLALDADRDVLDATDNEALAQHWGERWQSNGPHQQRKHNTMTATRIYAVSRKQPQLGGPEANHRLVRAVNASQAMRHVAEHTLTVGVAGQDQLVDLVAAGVKVEDAKTGEPQ